MWVIAIVRVHLPSVNLWFLEVKVYLAIYLNLMKLQEMALDSLQSSPRCIGNNFKITNRQGKLFKIMKYKLVGS